MSVNREPLQSVCSRLLSAAAREPDGYASEYRDALPDVARAVSVFSGGKHNLYVDDRPTPIEHVFASVLMTDLTSLFLPSSGDMRLFLPRPESSAGSVTIPWSLVRSLAPDFDVESIGIGHLATHDTNAVARQFEPLINAGRLLVRPRPFLAIHPKPGLTDVNSRMYALDPDSPLGNWVLAEGVRHGEDTMMARPVRAGTPTLVRDVVVPYIRGMSVSDFARILEDEEARLASLRSAIRSAVKSLEGEPDAASRIMRDVVDPELAMINAQFRAITWRRAFRIAGLSVGTVTLSLLAYSTPGLAQSLATLLGPAGVAGILAECGETIADSLKVKERPFYPLWRIRRST